MSKPNSIDSGRYQLIMNIRHVLQRTENFVAFLYLTVVFSMYLCVYPGCVVVRIEWVYMPSIIFVHADCIAVHDECEFIYGQGLWICIQDMQVNMPCV